MMRIITGCARGVGLIAPEGMQTRPTSERTKEAVFSMLQFELVGRQVLDLFAGSGQMGLEALSRGAEWATLVDASRDAVAVIRKNGARTRLEGACTVVQRDFSDFLQDMAGRTVYDLVFLDPPYASEAIPQALTLLLRGRLLKPTARIVCESGDALCLDDALQASFETLKTARYGRAYITLLRPVFGDGATDASGGGM